MGETLYKVLSADGKACHGGNGKWHLPTLQPDGTYKPGKWMPKLEGIVLCERGYHLCRRQDVVHWLNEAIYEAEATGDRLEATDKIVVSRARLLRPLTNWTETNARLFACDCAEDALPFWERYYPGDERPRKAIASARAYARGKISAQELAAARDAARDAAWAAAGAAARDAARDAAWAAARDAAWAAARAAARDAAGAAARAAAWAAAGAAAWAAAGDAAGAAAGDAAGAAAGDAAGAAAGDAAGAAAGDAAGDAAGAAAGDAAGAAAGDAQTENLFAYLEGRKP